MNGGNNMPNPASTPKQCILEFLPTISILNRVGALMGDEKKQLSNLVSGSDPEKWMHVHAFLTEIQTKRQVVSDLVCQTVAAAIKQVERFLSQTML